MPRWLPKVQISMYRYSKVAYLRYGFYHGASHLKLGLIAAVEPLQSRLNHISILWAARSLRTGDKVIREFLEDRATPSSPVGTMGQAGQAPGLTGPSPRPFISLRSMTHRRGHMVITTIPPQSRSPTRRCSTPKTRDPNTKATGQGP